MHEHSARIIFLFSLLNLYKYVVGDVLSNVNNDCNLNYNVDKLFGDVEDIDGQYAQARTAFHELVGGGELDDRMTQDMMSQRGAAVRTVYEHSQEHNTIPAGFNLGGHVVTRQGRNILMFYRMKLRNNTVFQLDSVQNDFKNMTLSAELRMNELRLLGTFSSCRRRRQSLKAYDYYLSCRHKYGQVEIVLSNVRYKLQGRYRLLQDKLKLQHIVSTMDIQHMDVSMPSRRGLQWSRRHSNLGEEGFWRSSLDEFIVRLKTKLDQWLQDYFNDYLMYFVELENRPEVYNVLQYDLERTKVLNHFVDNTIDVLTSRLRDSNQTCPSIPDYTLSPSTTTTMLELVQGRLIGLDSMYRRSGATVSPGTDTREINAVVGFSNMKVLYSYELVRNKHPYKGLIVLTADDVSAQLSIKLSKSPKRRNDYNQVDVNLEILKVSKSNFITVRGVGLLPALKCLLDTQIKSIMAEAVVKAIKNLGAAASCEPAILVPQFTFDVNENDTIDDENDDDYNEDKPEEQKRGMGLW